MHLIFIGSNLCEMDFPSLRNAHSYLFQGILHCFGKHLSSYRGMFAHSSIPIHPSEITAHASEIHPPSRAAWSIVIQISNILLLIKIRFGTETSVVVESVDGSFVVRS